MREELASPNTASKDVSKVFNSHPLWSVRGGDGEGGKKGKKVKN